MKIRHVECPKCRKRTPIEGRFSPFCSERCRVLDLGRWLNGSYRIAGQETDRTERDREEP
ncbi:MAG TPA: DNA gyrase inhibitor YacG [Acidobacteriota bacterium]|nr:DNA gyrase inhibitor YacG [Acidobacteriota bacterium]